MLLIHQRQQEVDELERAWLAACSRAVRVGQAWANEEEGITSRDIWAAEAARDRAYRTYSYRQRDVEQLRAATATARVHGGRRWGGR